MTSPLSTLTTVTTQEECYKGGTPIAKFFIGPTNPKGRYPAVCEATLTPVVVFGRSFKELTLTIGRFFNNPLPIVFIGKTRIVTGDVDNFIPLLNGCRFLHREIGGYHVLARIYKDDVTVKKLERPSTTSLVTLSNIIKQKHLSVYFEYRYELLSYEINTRILTMLFFDKMNIFFIYFLNQKFD